MVFFILQQRLVSVLIFNKHKTKIKLLKVKKGDS